MPSSDFQTRSAKKGNKKKLLKEENNICQKMIDEARNINLVYLDREFNFIRVNEAHAKTCGYTPSEMIGKNHFALFPNEENEGIFRHSRDTGIPVHFRDKPLIFPDQPERDVTFWDWTLEPVKDQSGKVVGLLFLLVETTERKKTEDALKEGEQLYRAIFENSQDAFLLIELIYDNKGRPIDERLLKVNQAYESQTGVRPADVVGKRIKEYAPNLTGLK
jgi:PAS domain S-box-containing protein